MEENENKNFIESTTRSVSLSVRRKKEMHFCYFIVTISVLHFKNRQERHTEIPLTS